MNCSNLVASVDSADFSKELEAIIASLPESALADCSPTCLSKPG